MLEFDLNGDRQQFIPQRRLLVFAYLCAAQG